MDSDNRSPASKRPWRSIFIVSGLLLLLGLIFFRRELLADTYEVVKDIDLRYVLLLPLLQLLSYLAIAAYYREFFKAFDKTVSFRRMVELVLSLTFVDQVLPSGGISGTTYLVYGLKDKLKVGTITLAHLGRYMTGYFSYFVILTASLLFLLYGEGQVNSSIYGYLVALMVVAIAFGLFILWAISRRERVDRYLGSLGRVADFFSRKLRGGRSLFGEKLIVKTANEFFDGYQIFAKDIRKLLVPIAFMVISTTINVSTVYFSFVAIGYDLNPGAIFFSYAVANAAGILSVVPGDFGVHEGVMITMLTLTGSPIAEAITATLLYRVFVKFVFLPINFAFYSRLLAGKGDNYARR